ncbi:hypothetical protein B0H34DRAFT_800617 [Crassisporium funariophilum]|nr:hypothetical protein B0H34DRAFT_800617 [Crassisporium funariophilum]
MSVSSTEYQTSRPASLLRQGGLALPSKDAGTHLPQPFSRRFHQREDPEVAKARAIYLKAYIGGTILTILVIFAVFSIYWGSLWKVPAHPLEGWIVDFDGGQVGEAVVQDLSGMSGRRRTGREKRAHLVNPDASSRLEDAINNPDPSYNGSEAITAYGEEGRNENAYRAFIRPIVQSSLDRITTTFATQLALRLSSVTNLGSLMATSPQTVVSPISYRIVNLVPFSQPVASAVSFVGLIYLLILSFFIMIGSGARQASGIDEILRYRSIVALRLISSFVAYFFLSLFYSLLNIAFQLNLTATFGHAGFLVFWMLNWVGMLSVGLALEALFTVLTARFIPFFLIFWIILNVSVCVYPIETLPRIYRYGYAGPFYNISKAIRTIAFGTKNRLGLNFGVLLVWVLISCITLPILQWFVRRKRVAEASTDLAATYAALILADDGIEITADKIVALTNAANVELEPIWATLLAKALEGKNVKELLSNVGSGGGAPAAGSAAPAASTAAATEAPKAEEKKEEEKEESDDDMGFGLFD